MRIVLSGKSARAGEASAMHVAKSNVTARTVRIVVSPISFFRASLLDVSRPFDRRMRGEKSFVHLDADAGRFERPHIAVPVDRVRRRSQFVAEQVVLRYVALEISAIVDRA